MGLHALTDDGQLSWHCHNPRCSYHNCAEWHPLLSCEYHDAERLHIAIVNADGVEQEHHIMKPLGRITGNSHTTHVTDEQLSWTDNSTVALPRCPECGEQKFLKVRYSEDEKQAPNLRDIKRDKDGNVLSVTYHPQMLLHQKLADHLTANNNTYDASKGPFAS